ncbi:MAG: hypothetical protein JXR19_02330 [Bacteroidia bacterium]
MFQRNLLLFSLVILTNITAFGQKDSLRSEVAFHFEINQTGYSVFPSYRIQHKAWIADAGFTYNLSDGSLENAVFGAEAAIYRLLIQNNEFRNGLGVAYRFTSSLEHVNSHQYLLTSTQIFQLSPNWAIDVGLGYGLAIDKVKGTPSTSSVYYLSQMIQLGCAYTL